MGRKSRVDAAEQDLFWMELVNLIDQRHELVKLASPIDCSAASAASATNCPAIRRAWPR
jgi:IS5 family transposase